MLGSRLRSSQFVREEAAITATAPEVRIFKRRVVERPRLFALLDESTARVKTLVAPAGYGKTTLAEQWVARDGRRGAWYTARSASTDVAALALGLARSCASVVEGCDVRLREHLRALPAPAENVTTLAEILSEDLADWPEHAWVVIDDYHELAEEPKAERFVAELVAASSIAFLIASRQRPTWVTTKAILYGDVLELNQTALAMDNNEAREVLVGRSAPSASGLVSLANGWPAVIGLAGVSSAEIESDAEQVPESLYRFFAEEVFSALGTEVQQGLTTLAVAPILDRQLASAILGPETGEEVCAAALDVGILVERGQQLDLHPLARAFLAEWSGQLGLEPAAGSVDTCIGYYREQREWDALFEVLAREGPARELEGLMRAALDELLDTARLSTLQRWCELAAREGLSDAIFSLANAELMLRHGRHVEAMGYAEAAAGDDRELAFRALSLAGRAAHLASREEDALDLYRRAEEAAGTDGERRDAKWGQLGCLIDLELPSAHPTLGELCEGVTFADPREVVRAANHRLYFQLRLGALELDEADLAFRLLSVIDDALVESSFLSGYSIALALSSRYRDAARAAAALLAVAEQYRLDFAAPYARCALAMSHSGLRQWTEAERAARGALEHANERRDVHVALLSSSILLRVLVQQARVRAALETPVPDCRGALKASVAEFNCSRALALACAGRGGQAMELVDASRESSAVEPVVLSSAVAAVVALRSSSSNATERVRALEDVAFRVGALDLLVVTYRACPEVLPVLLRGGQSGRVSDLISRVGDAELASAAGLPVALDGDRTTLLSPREREVFELLRTGLTNRQIAQALFIEESTVKVHAHHIYDKLGVRSRTALTVQAVLERLDQATSATGSTSSGSDS